MKKILLPLVALAFATPAAAQSIVVTGSDEDGLAPVSVAYEELKAGQNQAAVDKLTHSSLEHGDPSRLINLGTAYARLGRTSDAAAAYDAALASPIRYDLELADGRYVDSRWAARTALANLATGRPVLALAR